jgi:hypothetical protein
MEKDVLDESACNFDGRILRHGVESLVLVVGTAG